MRDHLTLGSTPYDEPCAQVGEPAYPEQARVECEAYREQLRRVVGPEKGTAKLSIKGFPHDFGTYYEVVCWYDDSDETGLDYAIACEAAEIPLWDDEARTKLGGMPSD